MQEIYLSNFLMFLTYKIPFEIFTNVRIFFFQVVFVDLKPDPVDILGIAKITRSPSNSKDGPWFYVDTRKTPPFTEVGTDSNKKNELSFFISFYI